VADEEMAPLKDLPKELAKPLMPILAREGPLYQFGE
jgi:hypothetical protein